ncbi:hypothetical protein ACTXT7_002541 [Hymenolepis weldensis]
MGETANSSPVTGTVVIWRDLIIIRTSTYCGQNSPPTQLLKSLNFKLDSSLSFNYSNDLSELAKEKI